MKDTAGRVRDIIKKDPRYTSDAYLFVLSALQYTRAELGVSGHVTGQQLLSGIRMLGLEHYGAMAKLVFEHWGVTKTVDFGHIVVNMVNEKILSKTPEDSLDDFKDVYDFEDVFVKQYRVDFRKTRQK